MSKSDLLYDFRKYALRLSVANGEFSSAARRSCAFVEAR
jgi:hypothetical protein